jgi:hypothetical protein
MFAILMFFVMSAWSFLKPDLPTDSKRTASSQKGLPSWYEEIRHQHLKFLAMPFNSPNEIHEHLTQVNAAREQVGLARQRIAAALATNSNNVRLQAVDFDYRNWLIDTCDPSIMRFHRQIETELTRLRGVSNANGTRATYWELAGQVAACLYGMAAVLLLREQHCTNLPARFEELKLEMAEYATRKANELATLNAVEEKFGRLIRAANNKADLWRERKREAQMLKQQEEAKRVEAKRAAKNSASVKAATKESGFISSSVSTYRR